jgi:hypothetical protein
MLQTGGWVQNTIRRAGFGALIAALAFAGVACGDDDDTETGSGSETEADAGDNGGDTAAFCDAVTEANAAFQSDAPPENGEEIVAALEESAPEELSEQVATVAGAARDAIGGDSAAFESEEFGTAFNDVELYRFDNCESDAQVEVTAVDYAFEGVPESVPAGTVAFKLTNDSEAGEEHEMVVFARAEGETRSFEELLALPEEESESAVIFGGAAFAPPGAESATLIDLTPGEWAMVCFIPVGGAEDGAPHFTQGMITEFTVE